MSGRHVSWVGFDANIHPRFKRVLEQDLGMIVDITTDATTGLAQVTRGNPAIVLINYLLAPGSDSKLSRRFAQDNGSQVAYYLIEQVHSLDRREAIIIPAPGEIDPSDYIMAGANKVFNASTTSNERFLAIIRQYLR